MTGRRMSNTGSGDAILLIGMNRRHDIGIRSGRYGRISRSSGRTAREWVFLPDLHTSSFCCVMC